MDLSIVIVNWKSVAHLRACLAAIGLHPPGVEHEAIVIDNASGDGCGEMLAKEFPRVLFIQSDANMGFAGANNAAFQRASGNIVLFLNPDTEVRDGALARMVDAAKTLPDAGAIGGRLLNSDFTLQTSCVQAFPTIVNQVLDSEFLHRLMPQSGLWGIGVLFRDGGEPVPVEAVSGACLMMRRELFEKLGGFETEFFMYGEDIDLCYRAARAGYLNYHVPQAVVVHHGGGSTASADNGFSAVMMRESVHRFLLIRHGCISAATYRCAMCAAALVRVPLAAMLSLRRRAGSSAADGTVRKWLSILRWSVGLERWSRRAKATPLRRVRRRGCG